MLHILLGPPGAGKGTQAKLLQQALGCKVVSMGDILRKAAITDPRVKEIQSRGELVPSDYCMELIENELKSIVFDNTPIILDGFPRNMEQAVSLNPRLIASVTYITLPQEEVKKRLKSRARADDNEEVIKKRLESFSNDTYPVVEYFFKHCKYDILYQQFDGTRPVGDIHAKIIEAIHKSNESV